MLKKLSIRGFKSLADVTVELPPFTVLFGPNAAGKSNFLDAVQALSRVGTSRTLSDALAEPIRGYPVEAFAFPPGGLSSLLSQERAVFSLTATLEIGKETYGYEISVAIDPRSGSLSVDNEKLAALGRGGEPKGKPSIEKVDSQLRIRRKSKPAHPRQEPVGLNHSILSDPRLGGVEYRAIERVRSELSGWRSYYLDPRVAMRSARPPADVRDIGVLGEDIAPFLYKLNAEEPKHFKAVERSLRSLIPSVEHLSVDLDTRRGTLDIEVLQDGTTFSSRIISEGTLRVLAICAISVNPWSGSLLAFEEPENGVHPRRLELIAKVLSSLALDRGKQVIVTTHSPVFAGAVFKEARKFTESIALLAVSGTPAGTRIRPFSASGTLFQDQEILRALSTPTEESAFEELMIRGMLDD